MFAIHTAEPSTWDGAAAILDIRTGADELSYVLHSLHDEFTLDRDGAHVAHPAASASLRGADLIVTVPYSELGRTTALTFRVSTPGPSGEDEAPDRSFAAWRVTLAGFAPAWPVHAKPFSFAGPQATCRATLGGLALRGTCSWRIPANAAGKTLVVVVDDGTGQHRYTFRVR